MLKAVLDQKPVPDIRKYVDWKSILKVSELQNIVSIAYYGMLGKQKEVSPECEEQFYEKYKKERLLHSSYEKAQEVLMWQMEKNELHGVILAGVGVQDLYVRPELAYVHQIEILLGPESLSQFCELMREMDYEEQENRSGKGIVFRRSPGIQVVLYEAIPIRNRALRKVFPDHAFRYLLAEPYKYVHLMSEEEEFLYRCDRLVEAYAMGSLKVRNILDFWLFQKSLTGEFSWESVKDIIIKAKVQEFLRQIEHLATLWFGKTGNYDYRTAVLLEEYIFLEEIERAKLDELLMLSGEKARLDFYRRDREEEWRHKKKEWLFPPAAQMKEIFPVLQKFSFLLPFYWLKRFLKIYVRMGKKRLAEVIKQWHMHFYNVKIKLKERFRRTREEGEIDEGAWTNTQEEGPER